MSKISHYHDHAEDLALEEQTNYYPKSLFSEGVPFYNDGERLELFKKIAHLVEFTDLILFVKGPPSSGKTKLIQNRFVFEAKSNWRPVILDASIHKTSEQVLAEMSKKLDLPRFTPQLKDSANSFVEQLDEYRSNGFLVVLVVDNAQNLKKEVVELLVQLAKPNNDASPLSSLILFGEHPPTSLLKEVNVKSSSEPYKEMQIPLMNEVDLNHYIDDILNDIGHFSNQPFTPRCRQKIVEKSKGQIKTINSLIDKEWRRYSNSQNKTERKKSRLPGTIKYITVTLGLAVIVSIGMFQFLGFAPDNSKPGTDVAHVSKLIPIPRQGSVTPDQTVQLETDKQSLRATTHKESVAPVETQTIINSESSDRLENMDLKTNTEMKTGFVLQLIGGRDKQAIVNFIQENKIEKDAHYVTSVREGKRWYSVIYGQFETRENAKTAAEDLQKRIANIQPWIRDSQSITDMSLDSSFASQ